MSNLTSITLVKADSVWMILPVPGMVANVINVHTFLALGVHDGVSVSFLALSLSDLGFCISSFMFGCSRLSSKLETVYEHRLPVNPFVFIVAFYQMALCTYGISGLSTAYLAVARCMCVVKPLQFKSVFTKAKSIQIHTGFTVFAIGCLVALYSQMGIMQKLDPLINVTRGMLTFTDIREDVKEAVYFLFGVGISIPTQVLMVLCVAVMASSLRKSQNFRQTVQLSKDDAMGESSKTLSGKELQVVKQVVLISVVFLVCSLPKMFTAVYSLLDPEFVLGGKLTVLYQNAHLVRNGFELINAGSTILIYIMFNSKFKASLFSKQIKSP